MHVPTSLERFTRGCVWTRITIGCSEADTFRLDPPGDPGEASHAAGTSAYYLKVAPAGTLTAEKELMEWLEGQLLVPRVLGFCQERERDYLLMSALPGRDAASQSELPPEKLVALLARGLRQVHSVPISHCPFDHSLAHEIEAARQNLLQGRVDEDDFDEARRGRSASELFDELLRLRPPAEDVVFTHGDYCPPNIVIDQDAVGFIDLGRAGKGDRYRDIALALRSIGSDLGVGFEDLFLQEYGISRPDAAKIAYFQLLDEFF